MNDKRRDHDQSALPSGRGLLFGFIALAAAVVLAAWILSSQLNKRAEPSPPAPAVPLPLPAVVAAPPPLHPPEAWSAAAGVVDDAQAVSALILALDGKWSDAHRHVRGMYRAIAPGDAKSARKHNDVGLAFFRTGDYASAAKAFDLALRADPADAEAANNLGYAYIKAGRVREGVPCLVRALRLVPARSSAWINLSEALAELGHDDAALAGLLLAVRYSANRDEIREFLIEAAREHSSNAFRKQAARALDQIASVPRS